ncbi:MAG: hypothetical protein CM1200mP16_15890 [Nitrospina sp.]|nr:MAG: hypothetical protein CM1200mP16_15890 [Nitrospina sp.]
MGAKYSRVGRHPATFEPLWNIKVKAEKYINYFCMQYGLIPPSAL